MTDRLPLHLMHLPLFQNGRVTILEKNLMHRVKKINLEGGSCYRGGEVSFARGRVKMKNCIITVYTAIF